jgi:hypothetical protein
VSGRWPPRSRIGNPRLPGSRPASPERPGSEALSGCGRLLTSTSAMSAPVRSRSRTPPVTEANPSMQGRLKAEKATVNPPQPVRTRTTIASPLRSRRRAGRAMPGHRRGPRRPAISSTRRLHQPSLSKAHSPRWLKREPLSDANALSTTAPNASAAPLVVWARIAKPGSWVPRRTFAKCPQFRTVHALQSATFSR